MSTLLAIDTATPLGSVAVGREGELLADATFGARHAEELLPAIDGVLRAARLPRSALTGIVVGGGPGSFTGVRIAAAAGRALASALEVPLYAYSSLAAVAAGVGAAGATVCALFDARRGEVYGACYRVDPTGWETLLAPVAADVGTVVAQCARWQPAFAGDGAQRYRAALPAEPVAAALSPPRAAALLWLAWTGPEEGRIRALAGWEPDYVRAPGVERSA